MAIGDTPLEAETVTTYQRGDLSASGRSDGSAYGAQAQQVVWWKWTPPTSMYVDLDIILTEGTYVPGSQYVMHAYVRRPLENRGPVAIEGAGKVESVNAFTRFTQGASEFVLVHGGSGYIKPLFASAGETYYILVGTASGEPPTGYGLAIDDITHESTQVFPLGVPRWIESPAISPDGAYLAGWVRTHAQGATDYDGHTEDPWLWVGTNEAVPRTIAEAPIPPPGNAQPFALVDLLRWVSPTQLFVQSRGEYAGAYFAKVWPQGGGTVGVNQLILDVDGFVADVDSTMLIEQVETNTTEVRRHDYQLTGSMATILQTTVLGTGSFTSDLRITPAGALAFFHGTNQRLFRWNGTVENVNIRSLVGDQQNRYSEHTRVIENVGNRSYYFITHDQGGSGALVWFDLVTMTGDQFGALYNGVIKSVCRVAPGVVAILYGSTDTAGLIVLDLNVDPSEVTPNGRQAMVLEHHFNLTDVVRGFTMDRFRNQRLALTLADAELVGAIQVGQPPRMQFGDREHWYLRWRDPSGGNGGDVTVIEYGEVAFTGAGELSVESMVSDYNLNLIGTRTGVRRRFT